MPSLCDKPIIGAADRMSNDTIRVYRDQHYWELPGVADGRVKPLGPFRIPFKYMENITTRSTVMTITSGPMKDTTWKFEGQKQWQWSRDGGAPVVGQKTGIDNGDLPKEGLDCAFNTGDLDPNTDYPVMIGIKGAHTFYWKTYQSIFERIGGFGTKNSETKEVLPPDPTACTAVRVSSSKEPFYVLLFRKAKYCLRPINKKKACEEDEEWKSNKELFGCPGAGDSTSKTPEKPGPDGQTAPEPEPAPDEDNKPEDKRNDYEGGEGKDSGGRTHSQWFYILALLLTSYLLKPF